MVSGDTNPHLLSQYGDAEAPGPGAPTLVSTNAPQIEVDDLYNYDAGVDEMFRDVDTNMNAPARLSHGGSGPSAAQGASGLGIDEEVKVTKKRKVHVKLDHDRLLSQAGIPKLRRISRERLRFKGKGHEFSDVGRLLALYQLWLDDLFPKAKFADGLAIIEKLGHSRRMQLMRREWIDQSKPKLEEKEQERIGDVIGSKEPGSNPSGGTEREDQTTDEPSRSTDEPSDKDLGSTTPYGRDHGDLYGASPLRRHRASGSLEATETDERDTADVPDEDDLDALLNEGFGNPSPSEEPNNEPQTRSSEPNSRKTQDEGDDEDELEAMREMEAMV